jgi:hypothetical protein
MGLKLDQNNSLCQLSTKECSKFREAVETREANVGDFPEINREVRGNPGSGYVAIVKPDGTAKFHGFGVETFEASSPVRAPEDIPPFKISTRESSGWTEEAQQLVELEQKNYDNFNEKFKEYAKETGRFSANSLADEVYLQADFENYVLEDSGVGGWVDVDLGSLPPMDVLADRYETHLRSEVATALGSLDGLAKNDGRRFDDGQPVLHKLYSVYTDFKPPSF